MVMQLLLHHMWKSKTKTICGLCAVTYENMLQLNLLAFLIYAHPPAASLETLSKCVQLTR